jgi:hypothetical protein
MKTRVEDRQKGYSVLTETKSHYFDVLAIVLVTVKLAFLDVKLQRTPEEMEGFVMLLVGWLLVRYYTVATVTSPVRTTCGCSLKGKFLLELPSLQATWLIIAKTLVCPSIALFYC